MSIKAMVWAWAQPVPSAPKHVLLALADHADDDGVCWPGVKGVAEKCSLKPRAIQRHIKTLERLGLVLATSRLRADGSRTTNLYTLALHILHPPIPKRTPRGVTEDTTPLSFKTPGGVVEDTPSLIPREPSLEPSGESSPNGEVHTGSHWITILRAIPGWNEHGEPHLSTLVIWAEGKGWTEDQLERSAIGLSGVQAKTLKGYGNMAAAFQRRLNQGFDVLGGPRVSSQPTELGAKEYIAKYGRSGATP